MVSACQQQPESAPPVTPNPAPPSAQETPPPPSAPETLPPPSPPTPSPEPAPAVTPSPTPTSKITWILHKEPEEGYAIALPSTWRVVTEEKTQSYGKAKLMFYAVDPVSSTPVLDSDGSFSVVRGNLEQEVSLDVFMEREIRGLEADPTTVNQVYTRRVELLAGEAIMFRYTKNYPHRTGLVVFIQYTVIKGKELYVLTSETTPSLFEKYAPIFGKMAKSFRLLE